MNAVKTFKIPVKINLILSSFAIAVYIFQYYILPLYLLPNNEYWALLLIIPLFFNNSIWALMHEGVHRILVPKKIFNDLISRTLFIFFGSPFHFLKLGHISHHRYNRASFDRSESYNPQSQSKLIQSIKYYYSLLGGLYFNEILAGFIFLLPTKWIAKTMDFVIPPSDKESKMTNEFAKRDLLTKNLTTIRIDVLLILAMLITSFIAYLPYWELFILIFFIRGLNISLIDNAFHYGTSIHSGHFSKNLKLNSFMSKWILNFNYHYIHHLHANIPWIYLDQYDKENSEKNYNFLKSVIEQFKGPIPLQKLDFPISNKSS